MSDDLETRLRDLLAERGRLAPGTVERALDGIDALPARPVRFPRAVAAAVVVMVAVIGIALVTLLRPVTDVAAPSSAPPTRSPAASPSAPAAASTEPTPAGPTIQPPPVWARQLADHLDCDGMPSTLGSDTVAAPEPMDVGDTPAQALENYLIDYTSLPISGYAPPLVDGHWALHRYLVDGRPKVHAVSTNQFPGIPSETRWQVVGMRACDPSEFAQADLGPDATTIWRDADDHPVRSDVISSHPGSGHCGWEGTVFLSLGPEDTLYLRDPEGVLANQTLLRFRPDGPLPDDAVDTGYHTDEWHLFTIPSGRAVFMRTPDGRVERWPRATEQIGCA
jgi:hypothetical protein